MSGVRIDEYDDNYANDMRSPTVVVSEVTTPSIRGGEQLSVLPL
jgi:hypothetical protein